MSDIIRLKALFDLAKARFEQSCYYATDGGSFVVDQSLIAYVGILVGRGNTRAVILDEYKRPIPVGDLPSFLDNLISIYNTALNRYHHDWSGNIDTMRKSND